MRVRSTTAREARPTSTPPIASASDRGEVRRWRIGGLSGVGDASVRAPVRTAGGTGVRSSGIGLFGVVTPIDFPLPVLAIAISWLRVGSSGVSEGEPITAMMSSIEAHRSAGSFASIRVTAARSP